jgi:hypothetical protein
VSASLLKVVRGGARPTTTVVRVSSGNYDMLEESLTFHVQEVKKA